MIDEKCRELIHGDLDGELPESSRAEIGRLLLASPEARAYSQDMRRVCEALDGMPEVAVPSGLREMISDRVALAAGAATGPRARRTVGMSTAVLRYAAVFAGGILAAALAFLFAAGPQAGLATSDLVGTMAGLERAAPGSPVDSARLEQDQLQGVVNLYDTGSTLILEFDLSAKEPVDVVAVYDGAQARFSSTADVPRDGQQHYALAFASRGATHASVALQFFQGGVLVHEEQLETEGDR
jgi:anti-sigma factor RsiW